MMTDHTVHWLTTGLNCKNERRGLSWYNTRDINNNCSLGQNCWNILQYLALPQRCFAKWAQKLACKQYCEGRVSCESFRSVYSCTVSKEFWDSERFTAAACCLLWSLNPTWTPHWRLVSFLKWRAPFSIFFSRNQFSISLRKVAT